MNIHFNNRKMLAGIVAGAVLLTGSVGCYAAQNAQSEQTQESRENGLRPGGFRGERPPQPDKETIAAHIAERGNVDQATAKKLLEAGYHPMDIEAAGIIAKATGKNIQAVLDKKKINNRWVEVAKDCGMSEEDFRRSWQKNRPMGGPGEHRGPGHHRGDMPPQGGNGNSSENQNLPIGTDLG